MQTPANTLSELLEVFGATMDIVQDGIVVVLPSGVIAYANNAAARFLALSKEELVGSHTGDIQPSVWEDMSRVFQDGVPLERALQMQSIRILGWESRILVLLSPGRPTQASRRKRSPYVRPEERCNRCFLYLSGRDGVGFGR